MKFLYSYVNEAPLNSAIETENFDMVKLLLKYPEIDVNIVTVFFLFK